MKIQWVIANDSPTRLVDLPFLFCIIRCRFLRLHFHFTRLQKHPFKLVCHVYIYVLIKSVVSGNKKRCLTQPFYTVCVQLSSFRTVKNLRYFNDVPHKNKLHLCVITKKFIPVIILHLGTCRLITSNACCITRVISFLYIIIL